MDIVEWLRAPIPLSRLVLERQREKAAAEVERLRATQTKCELLEDGRLLICKNHAEVARLTKERDFWYMRALKDEDEVERLTKLLRSALYHVEGEGDDTLATIIKDELAAARSKREG